MGGQFSCDVLNGDRALQCLTAKVIGEIKYTSSVVAKRIIKEGKIVSAKIKKTSVNNANTIQKYDFSFARSFLQVYDKLDLLVSTCSKLVGIKRLRCLINLGTNSVNITTSTAAKDVLRIAGNTADQVTTLTRVVNTISGFEDLSKQIKKSTNDMMKKAKDISGKIKTAGKSTINDINKAGGIQDDKKSNVNSAQSLSNSFNGLKNANNAFVTKAEDMIGKIKKKQATKVNSTIDPAQGVEDVVEGVTKKVEDVVEGVTNKVKQTLSSKIEMSTNAVMEKAEDMIGKRKKKKK